LKQLSLNDSKHWLAQSGTNPGLRPIVVSVAFMPTINASQQPTANPNHFNKATRQSQSAKYIP
jgi:hypothetical protein